MSQVGFADRLAGLSSCSQESFPSRGQKKMRRAILIVLFLFSALPAGAKDFYIAARQAGTGSGTECSTPKAYNWFNTATSWGTEASQIGPGTTVHLCGTNVGTP